MATNRVADMTIEELKAFIERVVHRQLVQKSEPGVARSVKEILDSIDRHRWTPPPGAKSSLELLREDRDA